MLHWKSTANEALSPMQNLMQLKLTYDRAYKYINRYASFSSFRFLTFHENNRKLTKNNQPGSPKMFNYVTRDISRSTSSPPLSLNRSRGREESNLTLV